MLQINFRGLDTTYPRPSCDVNKSYDLYYFLGSSLLVEVGEQLVKPSNVLSRLEIVVGN